MTWIRWKWIMKWVTTRNRSCGKLRFAAAIILQPEFSVWASIRQRQRRALCLHALRGQLVYEERFDQTNRQRDGCLSSLSMRIFIVRYTREIREAHERKFISSTWEIGPSSHRSRRARKCRVEFSKISRDVEIDAIFENFGEFAVEERRKTGFLCVKIPNEMCSSIFVIPS